MFLFYVKCFEEHLISFKKLQYSWICLFLHFNFTNLKKIRFSIFSLRLSLYSFLVSGHKKVQFAVGEQS